MESYVLFSYKEFIARYIAEDFDDPTEEDWRFAEVLMENSDNFVTGQRDYIFGDNWEEQYAAFMENPEIWRELHLNEQTYASIQNVEELVNQLIG